MRKFLIFLFLVSVGCASAQKTNEVSEQQLPKASVKGPVALRLGAKKGTAEVVRYRSNTVSESFEEGAIRLRQEQGVEFLSRTETIKEDENKILQTVTTYDKQGETDLHTMAMPEVGEKLQMGLLRDGKVLMAGSYPQQSIFFVPQVSLPEDKVEVGDTWEMESQWVTLDEGVPFVMDMVSILKDFVKCGNETCADIEMSGEVRLQGSLPIGFKNEWRGRLLFAVESGTAVWSHVASREDYSAESVQRTVNTCLETVLEEPAALRANMTPICKVSLTPKTPPPSKPAPESAGATQPVPETNPVIK